MTFKKIFITFLLIIMGSISIIAGDFLYFINTITDKKFDYLDQKKSYDAIIALTGGSLRINKALFLLQKKMAPKLFISGVGHKTNLMETLILSGKLPDGIDKFYQNIELGYSANSTYENALEVSAWIKKNNIKSFILVTSSYHLPRSLLEIKRRIGSSQIEILPYPVFPENVKLANWWQNIGTKNLIILEYQKYLGVRARIILGPIINFTKSFNIT